MHWCKTCQRIEPTEKCAKCGRSTQGVETLELGNPVARGALVSCPHCEAKIGGFSMVNETGLALHLEGTAKPRPDGTVWITIAIRRGEH